MSYPFNVRVYGLLIWQDQLLVADELIKGMKITKFPGGGLEFGEGLREALKREIKEEIGIESTILEHFYTTDFFMESAWRKGDQVISVYYHYTVPDPSGIPVVQRPFEVVNPGKQEAFRWLNLSRASVEDLSLPIDKYVLEMLLRDR